LLDGLDLDFLNFSKGGAFQNFDDADVGFDNLDDLGGFRMRGMSEIDGIMSHPLAEESSGHTSDTKMSGQRSAAGSFDSTDIFAFPSSSYGGRRPSVGDNIKFEPDLGFGSGSGNSGGFGGYDMYGGSASDATSHSSGSVLSTSPLQYTTGDGVYPSGMRAQHVSFSI
jgi:hypothetical protein